MRFGGEINLVARSRELSRRGRFFGVAFSDTLPTFRNLRCTPRKSRFCAHAKVSRWLFFSPSRRWCCRSFFSLPFPFNRTRWWLSARLRRFSFPSSDLLSRLRIFCPINRFFLSRYHFSLHCFGCKKKGVRTKKWLCSRDQARFELAITFVPEIPIW